MAEHVWREDVLPYLEVQLHSAHERIVLDHASKPKRTGT